MKKIVLISSVGGHLEQLLNLKKVISNYDSYIITEKNISTLKLKKSYKNIYFIPYLSRKNIIIFFLKSIIGFYMSFWLLIKIKPDIIITTGSASCISMCAIGKIMGCKIIFIETFSRVKTKTLTGTICYRFADVFIVQWEELKKLYPKAICFGHIY